jgi:hypothetical protein
MIIRLIRFLAIISAFYLIYKLLLEQALDGSTQIVPILLLWLLSAYIVLPWVHRLLTRYYLPNYFVGRVRSQDGLLSDPVNLAFNGTAKDIHRAMKKAGWDKADELTITTLIRAGYCALFRKSYKTAPVGNMYLFSRKQNFAYQQQVGGSPNERHHVRFWKTPPKWYLPGGHSTDWLAAATYDKNLGIKIASGQIDHIIHEDVDEERDYIIETLKKAKTVKKVNVIEHFTNGYHDRNNGGDMIRTDGSLPFITL